MKPYFLRGSPVGVEDLAKPNILYTGKVSTFETDVTREDDLALFDWPDVTHPDFSWLFLPQRKKGVGLAKSLNPSAWFCAMRWNYDTSPRERLRKEGIVEISFRGKTVYCTPVHWGPNVRTERIVSVSEGAMFQLGCERNDIVEAKLVFGKRVALVG